MDSEPLEIKELERKIAIAGRDGTAPIDALTKAEREIFADHLASIQHFASAALFTTDPQKKLEYTEAHKKRFNLK